MENISGSKSGDNANPEQLKADIPEKWYKIADDGIPVRFSGSGLKEYVLLRWDDYWELVALSRGCEERETVEQAICEDFQKSH